MGFPDPPASTATKPGGQSTVHGDAGGDGSDSDRSGCGMRKAHATNGIQRSGGDGTVFGTVRAGPCSIDDQHSVHPEDRPRRVQHPY